jgi:hypothetical protein
VTRNHYREMTTMTEESIALREFLEKGADADLLREICRRRLMELEVQA